MRLNFSTRALPNLHNPLSARGHNGCIMTAQISLLANQSARYIGHKPKPYNKVAYYSISETQ